MKIRRKDTGIQTLAQDAWGYTWSELAVSRFDYDNNEAIITVGGGAGGQRHYKATLTAGVAEENGDLLTGLTRDTVLTEEESGDEKTVGELLSEWNTGSNGNLVLLRLNNGAEGHFELGVEDYVVLPFSTAEPVFFNIGDYVDLAMVLDSAQGKQFAKRYEICEFPKPTLNITTGGYDYELRLDAYYMKWKNKIFRYIPTEVSLGEEATGEASWSLTANLATHASVILRNLKSLGYTYGPDAKEFVVPDLPSEYDAAKFVTYDGVNIIDALTAMAEAFNCEWWVTDNVINFGKCEVSDLVQVEMGVEAERMDRADSRGTFATRLYAFGAERNLQANYRETDDEVLVNGVVQRRLMLPESVPFVDAWKYESDGTRVYTTLYKLASDNGRIYLDGYKVGTDGSAQNVGTSAYYDADGQIYVGGYKINVARRSDGTVELSRTYYTQSEYNALKAMTVEEVIEGIVQTDDIYPRTDDEVSEVSMYVMKFNRNNEGDAGELVYDDLQSPWQGEPFDPDSIKNGSDWKDGDYLQYYWRVKSAFWGEDFEDRYILGGQTLSLVFTGGDLNGMEFEVMFLGGTTNGSPDNKKWFELVANETYGRTLPDDTLKPAVGDTFVLYNWQAIEEDGTPTAEMEKMIESAEWELLDYCVEYLHDTMIDDGVYETELNPAWVYDESVTDGSLPSLYDKRTFAVGQRVLMVNDALFDVPRESRVVGFTINIDIPYDHPTYKIGESVQYSRIGAIESKVNQIVYNGNTYTSAGTVVRGTSSGGSGGGTSIYIITTTDTTTAASDTNVYSALRSRDTFILKDQDDTTPYNLTVNKVLTMVERALARSGVQFGNTFVTGLLGQGGMIDGTGAGELDSLSIRKWLEVPEIRFNRTTVMTGITWNTVGGGKIESVEIDKDPTTGANLQSGVITLKLEDGEIGMIAEDDLCMGIFHDFDNSYENDDYNEDQRNGNFHTAGFGTVYFRVDEILEEGDNSRFRYVLRGTDGTGGSWTQNNHPRAYMEFACYGNLTNTDRQRCKYTTTEYEIRLKNMDFWEYGQANIYYIAGLLDGFSMGDTVFSGEGIVIGNGYFYGTLQQFENIPYYIYTDTQGDQFLSVNDREPFKAQSYVVHGWDRVDDGNTKWSIARESGDDAADAVWNASDKAKAYDGYIELEYGDLGTNYNVLSTLFVIHAEGTDSGGTPYSVTQTLDMR